MDIELLRSELYFKEYKKLKGRKSKKDYLENLDIFLTETMDIFVFGEHTKYDNRSDSMYAVAEIANISISEVNKILESVDNIDSYT